MPRIPRGQQGGLCFHVINRGNGRATVFRKPTDFGSFLALLSQAREIVPMRLLGLCLMPNHFHLVLWPINAGDLSRWMHWLMTSHVRRYRQHYHDSGTGHVRQGRFKGFPVQDDRHLLTVLRYIEANPLRAGLVDRAENWPWSSLTDYPPGRWARLLTAWPVARPRDWLGRVNLRMDDGELDELRGCVVRGRPYGSADWTAGTAKALALESTLRPRGRPRKSNQK